MSSLNGAYDQNLLHEAPAATRAQRQEGYNVDLLDDRPTRPTSTQPLTLPQPIPSDTDVESSSLTQEKIVPEPAHASRPAQSFWRTRNGKITIFVIAIVIIGAIVGGAVGGTVGKISSNNNAPAKNGPTSSTSTFSSGETTSIPTTATSTGTEVAQTTPPGQSFASSTTEAARTSPSAAPT
ncbi:uncharacterized protein EDB93DRAFT_1254272 [Suillus bovinus]|uniref:uncharacterized protein n=1 Tax=Suillus bovinus TaxID=48563 RepID=UPI001B86EE48|nr:uncharacterized protein EDB93DRAFT_1254272 [Suillus bovinus]KAG2135355.1 hypothetical protein EDB93DRAFT_1254272 [Suillus bovinus]